MEGDGDTHVDNTKAEFFDAVSHPLRIRILQALNEKPMGFAELRRAVGIEGSGQLAFHLTKLGHMVEVNSEGDYALTASGKEAIWNVKALQESRGASRTSARPTVRHRSWVKPTIGAILAAVLVMGGVVAYEQTEYLSQREQIAFQQKAISVLQGGLPFTNGQNASMVLGQSSFEDTSNGTSQSKLTTPIYLAFDAAGDLWVSDYNNLRVLEFVPPFRIGMNASTVIGHNNFTRNWVSQASRNTVGLGADGPGGIAFDSKGNLWVVDEGADRILEFSPPFTDGMNASLVIGHPDFVTVGGDIGRNRIGFASEIGFDGTGNLWVLDNGHDRALMFAPPFSDGMNASLVLGQSNFYEKRYSSNLNGLNCTDGDLTLDNYGDVWVGDAGNNRILEFIPPFSTGMNASFIIDQHNLAVPTLPYPIPSTYLGWAVGFDRIGNLWASSNARLLAFSPPFIKGVTSWPKVEIGQQDFYSILRNGGQGGLSFVPSHPTFDRHGNLWVPDAGFNRLLEFETLNSSQTRVPSVALITVGYIGAFTAFGGAGISLIFVAMTILRGRARSSHVRRDEGRRLRP